jgi:multidrug efflux pump subunit AcrA (membrane-fusion protein)
MSKSILPLMAACLLATFGCSKKEEEPKAEAPPVQVTPLTRQDIHRIVAGDGVLFAVNQASVVPNISKSVQRFLVNRGDRVKAAQLVAVLEHADLSAAVAAAKGQLDQAEANYRSTTSAAVPEAATKARTDEQSARQQADAAQKALESREKLYQDGALARKLVDDQRVVYAQAKAQLETAQEHLRALESVSQEEQIKTAAAQVASAKAQLQAAQAQLAYAEIRSPIDGVIADRPLNAGEMATAGTPILTVMDISRVVARVNVPQAQAASIKVGNPATVVHVESGIEAHGRVTVVSPATDPASTTVQVWVQAENPGYTMKPGTSVRAAIVTELIWDTVVAPAAAILPGKEGGNSLLVVGADSVAHLAAVELGVHEGDRVQIVSGAQPGERVVVSGGLGVDDKSKVKVQ